MSARVPIRKAAGSDALEAGGVHELYDVNPTAVSLVDKGANRKRFFLRKRAEHDGVEEVEVSGPTHAPLIKSDWSAVYCVVAEPGWLEDPGLHGDQSVPDRWASEDEIRKACHRFAKNGGLINRMHEDLAPYGVLVENAIALDDFGVTGPDGVNHVIKRGSWYIALEPHAEGRKAIEAGEFTGVSLEGTGVRKLVEKTAPAAKREQSAGGGNVSKGMRELWKRIGQRVGLKPDEIDELLEAEDLAKGRPTFAERMAARDIDEELPQAMDVFRSVVWSAFYPVGDDDDQRSPREIVEQSADEFKSWLVDLLDRVEVAKLAEQIEEVEFATPIVDLDGLAKAERKFPAKARQRMAQQGHALPDGSFPIPDVDALKRAMKAIGRAPASKRAKVRAHIRRRAAALGATNLLSAAFAKGADQTAESATVGDVGLTEAELERITALEEQVAELPDKVAKAITEGKGGNGEGENGAEGEGAEGGEGGEQSKLDKLAESVATLTKRVEALGSGGQTPDPSSDGDSNGSGKAEDLRKSRRRGILSP